MRDHLDAMLADVVFSDAAEIIHRIKLNIRDTDMHIKKSQQHISSIEKWRQRHFAPDEKQFDWAGAVVAAIVVGAFIGAIVIGSTLDYWGK